MGSIPDSDLAPDTNYGNAFPEGWFWQSSLASLVPPANTSEASVSECERVQKVQFFQKVQ